MVKTIIEDKNVESGGKMIEAQIEKFCEHCKKETLHDAREDALELEYRCTICNNHQEIIKTFF